MLLDNYVFTHRWSSLFCHALKRTCKSTTLSCLSHNWWEQPSMRIFPAMVNCTSFLLWSTALRLRYRSHAGTWILWKPSCLISAGNSVWRHWETRWEWDNNKDHGWGGGGDVGLRTESGRDATGRLKLIQDSAARNWRHAIHQGIPIPRPQCHNMMIPKTPKPLITEIKYYKL